jgi:uncharacterized heparinase superfamily protein
MLNLSTYYHTVKHLRAVQLYGRLWYGLFKPRPDVRPAPPLRRLPASAWVRPARRRASLIGPERFRFLNEVQDLRSVGWDDPSTGKLWRYNLHYFDDLNARDCAGRAVWHEDLVFKWVRENPPGLGTAWEPYPTSLRIVNWVKWALSGHPLHPEYVESLAVQTRWLSSRLEYHLLGNHLFANGKALLFAGLFFEGPEARRWLDKGLRIVQRELPEQILKDGGHFERSTMYHALALEDMLDLCNVTTAFSAGRDARWLLAIQDWRDLAALMGDWLAAMCHPDGEIGFFNDAAQGVAPCPEELERYAVRLGLPSHRRAGPGLTHLSSSGYVRVADADAVAILDVAPIGPDYLPAHAHADTLSFELSLFGQRVLVNSGTSEYNVGQERSRQRGTRAHNTVIVNDRDSSEVWASFRVARRARPLCLEMVSGPRPDVRCAHDGYRTLPGGPRHTRRWLFDGGGRLTVEDVISGPFDSAEARFHLHPSVDVVRDGSVAVLRLPQGQQARITCNGGNLRTEASTWHPEFGAIQANTCVAVAFERPQVRTLLDWDGRQ